MKLQYLGDSKDSFKWDYHDYLVSALKFDRLNIALMMTSDDGGSHGSSHASLFPAREEIIGFCEDLKSDRALELLLRLPLATSSKYVVDFHSESLFPKLGDRSHYFDGFSSESDQVILVDPDNGFEPSRSFSDKHLRFSELDQILNQISESSVVSVFQHFRRKPFQKDFLEIKQRILSGSATALYWHSLMFVQVARSPDTIKRISKVNEAYAANRPIKIIANAV